MLVIVFCIAYILLYDRVNVRDAAVQSPLWGLVVFGLSVVMCCRSGSPQNAFRVVETQSRPGIESLKVGLK